MPRSDPLVLQLEPDTEWIAGMYGLTIFGRGAIVPGPRTRELKCALVEPRTARALERGRIGCEPSRPIDTYPHGGNSLLFHVSRERRIKVVGIRKPFARASLHLFHRARGQCWHRWSGQL